MRAFQTARLFIVALFCWPLATLPAEPETEAARALKELQEQREKALAAAAEPINLRFQKSLENLIRRAMQANDVETAMKIKAVLSTLPQVAAQELAGEWTLLASTGYRAEVTLRADGTGQRTDGGRFKWHIDGTTLYLDPSTTADKFQLPIKEGKLDGINSIGNTLTLTRKK